MLLLSIQQVGSARRLVVAVERFQQSRFTCPVLAQESKHLAAERLEAYIIQSLDTREIFRNMLELKNRSHSVSSCTILRAKYIMKSVSAGNYCLIPPEFLLQGNKSGHRFHSQELPSCFDFLL